MDEKGEHHVTWLKHVPFYQMIEELTGAISGWIGAKTTTQVQQHQAAVLESMERLKHQLAMDRANQRHVDRLQERRAAAENEVYAKTEQSRIEAQIKEDQAHAAHSRGLERRAAAFSLAEETLERAQQRSLQFQRLEAELQEFPENEALRRQIDFERHRLVLLEELRRFGQAMETSLADFQTDQQMRVMEWHEGVKRRLGEHITQFLATTHDLLARAREFADEPDLRGAYVEMVLDAGKRFIASLDGDLLMLATEVAKLIFP